MSKAAQALGKDPLKVKSLCGHYILTPGCANCESGPIKPAVDPILAQYEARYSGVVTARGTSNTNLRGNTTDRARRRAYLLRAFESDLGPGTCRCYRCGAVLRDESLTVDRIIPGCLGGKYRRNNVRPCCSTCNSETGGKERAR